MAVVSGLRTRSRTPAKVKAPVQVVRGLKRDVQAGPGHLTRENEFTLTSGVEP